jgi:hypothetical protein
MRNNSNLVFILFLLLAVFILLPISTTNAQTDSLTMDSPNECPSGGCAAGQRINFMINFTTAPDDSVSPNTQICIYTSDTNWADPEWISDKGLITSETYYSGDPETKCSTKESEDLLFSTYSTLPASSTKDQLEFALTIYKETTTAGYVRLEVFKAESGGSFTKIVDEKVDIVITSKGSTAYVSQTPDDCGAHSPCYVNSGDDESGGIGTGLRDAIAVAETGSEIQILNNYFIKDHAVMVDKSLTISGDSSAQITYAGNQYSEPMLTFTEGGTLKDLMINDGHWESPSRTLIQVDTAGDLNIEHNTLTSGSRAIDIKQNSSTGNITVKFNHIIDNVEALYSTNTSGNLNIYANNILDNGNVTQLHCNNNGSADHNYWGENELAEDNAPDCVVSNEKQLGAPILISSGGVGVEALEKTVTTTISYDIFDKDIGFKHTSGSDYDIVVVNHGQGEDSNIPFLEEAGAIDACSNFYDVFLTEGAVASNLILSLKYDRTYTCQSRIESSDHCNQNDDRGKYPLWWYDPANNITIGWDRTGQDPEGSGAGSASGQYTICDMDNNTINITIDDSGRPGLLNDLGFTPFVAGLPISNISVSNFSGEYITSKTHLQWTTSNEKNIREFRIFRANTKTGDYTIIKSGIDAIGDAGSQSTITYSYDDTKVTSQRNYYYKLEVIDNLGESVGIYGPINVYTTYSTKTATLYPTQTPIYIPNTSTPRQPTQVRTYRPSLGPTRTDYAKPTSTTTPTKTNTLRYDPGYPAPEDERTVTATFTPDLSTTPTEMNTQHEKSNRLNWVYLVIGSFGGLVLLIIISNIIYKSYIS